MEMQQGAGFVIWITGMNRAGKSTLAEKLTERLVAAGRTVELLDEDGAAALVLEGLTDSPEDRSRAVARLGFVARAVMRAGGVAVVAALSPSREARDAIRKETRRFVEVFADCSMEKLQQRDGEGIYRRAFAGELKNVPGVDVPYEPPTRAEVTVNTDQVSVADAVTRVFQGLVDAKYVGPTEFGRLTGGQRPRRGKPAPAGAPARAAKPGKAAAPAKAPKASKTARGGSRRKLDAKADARKAPRKVAALATRAAKRRR